MAACNLDTLTNDAVTNRFTGVLEDRQNALVLQLLCYIATALGMTCNVDTLINDATTNRFTGLTPDRQNAVLLQLLCDISAAGGSGAGGILEGNGSPVGGADDPPTNPAIGWIYWDRVSGTFYAWNTVSQAWE